ncbi:MAG: alpha/beta fold hydrolase [Vicinamibacterales bacterium]
MATLDTGSARIHYSRTGHGPVVILVQGVGVIGNGWKPQVDGLSDRYSLITIDNRGIGHSSTAAILILTIEDMAADVLAIADAEHVDTFHLVGHSMGGVIAQQVALSARHRVASLALLCTFLKGKQGTMIAPSMLLTAIRSRVGTRAMRRRAFVELVMPAAHLATVGRDELCSDLAQLFGRDLADSPPIVMQQLRAMGRFDASSRLSSLKGMNTLVVSAALDCIARPAYGKALAEAIPGARYVEFADAGHAVTIQQAAEINALLLQHFSRPS